MDIDRTPVSNGEFYCSPRCGGTKFCKREWYDEAVRIADDMVRRLGPGWEPHVFENLGWHPRAVRDFAHISASYKRGSEPIRYTCFINTPHSLNHQMVQFIAAAETPEDAYGFALQDARTTIARLREAIDMLTSEGERE